MASFARPLTFVSVDAEYERVFGLCHFDGTGILGAATWINLRAQSMRIDGIGKIAEGFYVLGHSAVPLYLLDGPAPLLFDAGFTGLLHLYEKDIKDLLGNRSPAFLFLTHSHWDHVGAAAYLKKIWPEMKIAGSSKTSEILNRGGALAQIKGLNENALDVLRSWGVSKIHEGKFRPFALDLVLQDGQRMEIEEGLTVEVIAVPGHTWDSTAYFLREMKILVAGEAAGCDGVCEFLIDHEIYRASLKRLAALDVEILCTAHNLVLTGPDVKTHVMRSMLQVDEYVGWVKQFLKEEEGDVDRVVARIKAAEWDEKPLPKQPLQAYLMSTKIRVKTILKVMGA